MKTSSEINGSPASMRRLLGVGADADLQEIKAAFRRKIKRLHPDAGAAAGSTPAIERLISAYSGLAALYKTGKSDAEACAAPGATATLTDVFALGELASASSDAAVRIGAIRALGRSGKRSAYPYLRPLFADTSEEIAAAAIDAAGRLGIRQSVPEMAALYARSAAGLRLAVVSALLQLRQTAGATAVLQQALHDSDSRVRAQARRSLAPPSEYARGA